jgi:D-3-phosphoglycerate dehydrogenase / 2-oxoglutarate reductase
MKVLIADTFEQSGIDGLKAAGCEVIYEPDLQGRHARAGDSDDGRARARRPLTKVTAAALDAGRLSLIVRAGAGDEHDRRGGCLDARHLRVELPGQERGGRGRAAFGLILALDRRIPDNVIDLRAGTVEQEGVCEGARAATAARWACSGSGASGRRWRSARGRSACRCRSGAGASTGRTRTREARASEELGLVRFDTGRRRTWPRASDILSVHLALTERHPRASSGGAARPHARPAPFLVNTARGEVVDYAPSAQAVRERGCAWARRVRERAGGPRASSPTR